ncbi:MAG TPA: signal recognition particle-docking protein FtsY [Fibrobacteres bacterium]|jgi:fused signal recognition particle receptor|nr:signal recognition particle-docking protein FtsY [Fibrobacterota bacterium]
MGFFDKIIQGLSRTRQTVSREIQAVFGKGKLTDETIEALEEKLLAADIGWDTAHLILEGVRKRARGQEIDHSQLLAWMAEEAKVLLQTSPPSNFDSKPHVIMFVGVNGAGKTTSIAKVAHQFSSQGKKVLLAACDTFRAGAISQLDVWATRAGVEIVKHQEGTDAASVAYDAYAAAKARGCDLLLIDTAGRLHTKDNLMEELRKLVRVLRKHDASLPHETLLVIDGNTGQNALPQFKGFGVAATLTGLVVTKLDGTAKGGAVLTLTHEFGVPVSWIGVGEGLDDLIPFDPVSYAQGLFGP